MSLENITKHPDLWFEDGNIVLVAENTGFRVYRGLLVTHSGIFRDMFLLPQPAADPDNTFEGCPIANMADDSAEEVAALLNIVCNGVDSFSKAGQRVEFSVIAAALRLGTKYSFQAIRQEALRRISLCYPKDLKDFQLHGEEPCDSPQCSIVWGPFDPIAVLNFARQYDLPDFVPAALYKCANHVSLSDLFLATTQAVGRYHKLSFEDLQDCIRAREYLAEENALLYNAFSELGSAENIVQNRFGIHPHCADGIKTMILDAHNSTFTEGRDALDPLDSWISLYGDHEEDPLCARCVRTLRQLVNGRQLITWSTLSKMFCPTSS